MKTPQEEMRDGMEVISCVVVIVVFVIGFGAGFIVRSLLTLWR